ncbi:hypothetical protein BGZ65_003963 [Modicella reniformis]|uniref:Uncharacterized protein n=1 Tax=Modicella reniformis TaxID=1440133 RepID=A0A9P6LZ60_9FUNG|nr:hypothetical protein BGZ65_003963 [Modicella reniformis]
MISGNKWFLHTILAILFLELIYGIARGAHTLNESQTWEWKRLFLEDSEKPPTTILRVDWMDLIWAISAILGAILAAFCVISAILGVMFIAYCAYVSGIMTPPRSNQITGEPGIFAFHNRDLRLRLLKFFLVFFFGIAWGAHALDESQTWEWKRFFLEDSEKPLAILRLDWMDLVCSISTILGVIFVTISAILGAKSVARLVAYCSCVGGRDITTPPRLNQITDVTPRTFALHNRDRRPRHHFKFFLVLIFGIACGVHILDESKTWEWKRLFLEDSEKPPTTFPRVDYMDFVWALSAILGVIILATFCACFGHDGAFAYMKLFVFDTNDRLRSLRFFLILFFGVTWGAHALNYSKIWKWKEPFLEDSEKPPMTILGFDWMDLMWSISATAAVGGLAIAHYAYMVGRGAGLKPRS